MRILLVQGNAAEAATTLAQLRAVGGVVDHLRAGEDATAWLATYGYDIVVLDHVLSDGDGAGTLRRIRAAGFSEPVLMLTGHGSGKSRAEVLRAGADDLLTKPYDREEFLARVEAVVRRRHGFTCSTLNIGPLEIDLSSRAVTAGDMAIPLTRKEYAVLELMAMRRGQVITKQHFLDHLYNGFDGPETRVIDVFVCNLRKKLGQHGLGMLIDTVRGHGYILRDIATRPFPMPKPEPIVAPVLAVA